MRHSFASWLDSLGVPHGVVQSLLGHASRDMTFHYTHSFPRDRQAGVDRLGKAVAEAIAALNTIEEVRKTCALENDEKVQVA